MFLKNPTFILLLVASFLVLSVETQAKNYFGVTLSESLVNIKLINSITISGSQVYGF